jgi:hypothetical protein
MEARRRIVGRVELSLTKLIKTKKNKKEFQIGWKIKFIYNEEGI